MKEPCETFLPCLLDTLFNSYWGAGWLLACGLLAFVVRQRRRGQKHRPKAERL